MKLKYVVVYLCITVSCVALILYSAQNLPSDVKEVAGSAWEVFYAVFGIIYAIIVGFILAELLGRYHRLISDIGNELNALQCIRDFLIYVDQNSEVKNKILLALRDYLNSVINREWHEMSYTAKAGGEDTSAELYGLMHAVEGIKIIDESDKIVLEKLIDKISDITEYRTERFDQSFKNLSPLLHILILFLSLIMVMGIMFIAISSFVIQAFMVVAMLTAVFLLYVVILDLNRPFVGLWNISSAPFERMLHTLDPQRFENRKD